MLITRDGKFAVVAIRIATASCRSISRSATSSRDPAERGRRAGRLIEDGAGRIHVALRHGGALFTLDGATATSGLRRAACDEPRGLAWQASSDLVHVACAGGELVSFASAAGGACATCASSAICAT